jgi:hypothetical protein
VDTGAGMAGFTGLESVDTTDDEMAEYEVAFSIKEILIARCVSIA